MKNTKSEITKFEILMSTVNNSRLSVDEYDHVVINQLSEGINIEKNNTNVFNYHEKGLSKSRNRALKHATGDICLFSDDDVHFKKNINKTIIDTFDKNPEADIITFQIETPEGDCFREYPKKKHWHDLRTLMNIATVEIAFRRNRTLEKELYFDELFGLGSVYPTGAEFIFLTDALKKDLNILYVPEIIAIHPKESSGKNWKDIKWIKAKAAVLYRVYGIKAFLWIFILSYKKYHLSEYSFSKYLFYMLSGIKEYRSYKK